MKLESDLQLQDGKFEEAAYSHRCSKIETADEIRTRANHNFQNK